MRRHGSDKESSDSSDTRDGRGRLQGCYEGQSPWSDRVEEVTAGTLKGGDMALTGLTGITGTLKEGSKGANKYSRDASRYREAAGTG